MTSAAGAPGRVYLVGFMGAGKTTVGRLLAAARGVPFLDLDQALEAMAGCTVREAFEAHGEPWFREREAELLRGTAALPGAVVALGGGTFAFEANREWISRHGVSVFLDVPFEAIEARLAGKAVDRPLFVSAEQARALYETRRPWYTMASGIVTLSGSETPEAVAEAVAGLLHRVS